MSELIYKCINPEECGLPQSAGEYTYIVRNSNFGGSIYRMPAVFT